MATQATWSGLIGNHEAMRGGLNYLANVAAHPGPFLLNNNLPLHGPWFNSAKWLEHAWFGEPHAYAPLSTGPC